MKKCPEKFALGLTVQSCQGVVECALILGLISVIVALAFQGGNRSGDKLLPAWGDGLTGCGTIGEFGSGETGLVFNSGMYHPEGLGSGCVGNPHTTHYSKTIQKFDLSGSKSAFASNSANSFGVAVQIPEPSSALLVSIGLLVLGGGLRLKRQQ